MNYKQQSSTINKQVTFISAVTKGSKAPLNPRRIELARGSRNESTRLLSVRCPDYTFSSSRYW